MTSPDYRPAPTPGWWVKSHHTIFGAAATLTREGGVGTVMIGAVIGGGATLTRTGGTGTVTIGTGFGGAATWTRTGGTGGLIYTIGGGPATLTRSGGIGQVGAQYSDNFNRGNDLSLGANWTERDDDWGIDGNAARDFTSFGHGYATYNKAMIYNDMEVSITVGSLSGSGNDLICAVLGADTGGECAELEFDNVAGLCRINSKNTWGGNTQRAVENFVSYTPGDVLTLRRIGAAYTGLKNGAAIGSGLTWTDPSNIVPRDSSHRLVGMGADGGSTNFRRIDSWSATNI